jgi:hypothetical protein
VFWECIFRSKLRKIPRKPFITSMETLREMGIMKVRRRKLEK